MGYINYICLLNYHWSLHADVGKTVFHINITNAKFWDILKW